MSNENQFLEGLYSFYRNHDTGTKNCFLVFINNEEASLTDDEDLIKTYYGPDDKLYENFILVNPRTYSGSFRRFFRSLFGERFHKEKNKEGYYIYNFYDGIETSMYRDGILKFAIVSFSEINVKMIEKIFKIIEKNSNIKTSYIKIAKLFCNDDMIPLPEINDFLNGK